jgi:hypothetical protein
MLAYILVGIAIVVFAYVKRHGFRRAWYILRTGAENPDWEKLGGDYFLASWEKRGPKNSAVNEEAKGPNVPE